MASKRSRMVLREGRFTSEEAEAAFIKLKRDSGITISKTLAQDKLSYPISDLFAHTSLLFLLTLAYPFHSNLLFEFYANLTVNSEFTKINSRVYSTNVEITKEDLALFLSIPNHGPSAHIISYDPTFQWTHINQILRNSSLHQHHHSVTGLVHNARVIQHVLRHTILPKAGDRTNITPIISLVTYYCMTNTPFDIADLLIRYIDNTSTIRDPKAKKKQNLALGHVIAYILQTKYAIANPEEPDHPPSFFSDHSFHTLFGGKKHKQPVEEEEEEEEEEAAPPQGESSAPPSYPGDAWVDRFERLELKLDQHIATTNARWQQLEERQDEERTWLQAQFDSLHRRWGPPDQGPPDY